MYSGLTVAVSCAHVRDRLFFFPRNARMRLCLQKYTVAATFSLCYFFSSTKQSVRFPRPGCICIGWRQSEAPLKERTGRKAFFQRPVLTNASLRLASKISEAPEAFSKRGARVIGQEIDGYFGKEKADRVLGGINTFTWVYFRARLIVAPFFFSFFFPRCRS